MIKKYSITLGIILALVLFVGWNYPTKQWTYLFNGKNLDGWQRPRKEDGTD